MIAVASVCKDEADIADLWLQHHIAEGVDRFFIADASSDGTKEILKSYDCVTVIDDEEPYCMQVQWMNRLSAMAGESGAIWLIASDVDEFWYATNGDTVANALNACPDNVVLARSYQHRDWNTRQAIHNKLPKIAFRWQPGVTLSMGNHEVAGIGGGSYDVLDIRELQFRSFEHFIVKVASRLATLDPTQAAHGAGWHYQILKNKSTEELRQLWNSGQMLWGGAEKSLYDPIPSHLPTGFLQHFGVQ